MPDLEGLEDLEDGSPLESLVELVMVVPVASKDSLELRRGMEVEGGVSSGEDMVVGRTSLLGGVLLNGVGFVNLFGFTCLRN
jgi:hypothetical protein